VNATQAAKEQWSIQTSRRWYSHKIGPKVFIILLFLYLIETVVGGIGLGWIALHPPRRTLTPSEVRAFVTSAQPVVVDIQDVTLVARDGVALHGWFMRPRESNGNAVILLHGVSDSRLGMSGYGTWLAENHYAVLLPDARGHGVSGGLATYGLLESDDIHQWVSLLERRYHPHCVYGLGESMGAAQLLQSLPKEPRFCAVVAESSFATFREVAYARFGRQFHTGSWLGRTFFRPTLDVGLLYIRLRYGLDLEKAAPTDAVVNTHIPVLLIHGTKDRNVPPYHSDEIQRQNPSNVVVWKVLGAVHTGAHQISSREFDYRVLEWFATHPDMQ
jgi:dipeptidyl aminopeptidase/acylaminoacyl peptidase